MGTSDHNRDRYKQKTESTHWHQVHHAGAVERALKPGNPAFLRLADLAIAFAGPNGHAEFPRGELTRFLDAADYRAVDSAIVKAIEYGLLAKGSTKQCLRLPLDVYAPYAGRGSDEKKEVRRMTPCATCHAGVVDPAECHPNRSRYTTTGLCESCYRKSLPSYQKKVL